MNELRATDMGQFMEFTQLEKGQTDTSFSFNTCGWCGMSKFRGMHRLDLSY